MASAVLKPAVKASTIAPLASTKPFYGFGCIETSLSSNNWGNGRTTKPFYGFGCIETYTAYRSYEFENILLNPSMASAVLKLAIVARIRIIATTTKPFYGFGCIETNYPHSFKPFILTTKPFYGFGCIETADKLALIRHWFLLNPSMASAVLKLQWNIIFGRKHTPTKPFYGFGCIETLLYTC